MSHWYASSSFLFQTLHLGMPYSSRYPETAQVSLPWLLFLINCKLCCHHHKSNAFQLIWLEWIKMLFFFINWGVLQNVSLSGWISCTQTFHSHRRVLENFASDCRKALCVSYPDEHDLPWPGRLRTFTDMLFKSIILSIVNPSHTSTKFSLVTSRL